VLVEFGWFSGFFFSGTHITVLRSGKAMVSFRNRGGASTRSFTLSQSKLERLKSALKQARFRSLRPRYRHSCQDCPTYSITYAGRTVDIEGWPQLRVTGLVPPRLARVFFQLNSITPPRIR
jgi:hypothetical protein